MSKSLVVGPNSVTAKVAGALSGFFTVDNCVIVYKADGSYKSWVPGRSLNAISALEVNAGYIIIMKEELDVDNLLDITDNYEPTCMIHNATEDSSITIKYPGSDLGDGLLNSLTGKIVYTKTLLTELGVSDDLTVWNFVSSVARTYVVLRLLIDNNGDSVIDHLEYTTAGTGSNNPNTGSALTFLGTLGSEALTHEVNTIYIFI